MLKTRRMFVLSKRNNNQNINLMRYVKLTSDQAKKINAKHKGYTTSKKNKLTGERENIIFCSSLIFIGTFGYDVERKFIEI